MYSSSASSHFLRSGVVKVHVYVMAFVTDEFSCRSRLFYVIVIRQIKKQYSSVIWVFILRFCHHYVIVFAITHTHTYIHTYTYIFILCISCVSVLCPLAGADRLYMQSRLICFVTLGFICPATKQREALRGPVVRPSGQPLSRPSINNYFSWRGISVRWNLA